jgi:hypothetical protein
MHFKTLLEGFCPILNQPCQKFKTNRFVDLVVLVTSKKMDLNQARFSSYTEFSMNPISMHFLRVLPHFKPAQMLRKSMRILN